MLVAGGLPCVWPHASCIAPAAINHRRMIDLKLDRTAEASGPGNALSLIAQSQAKRSSVRAVAGPKPLALALRVKTRLNERRGLERARFE
jgi:hypothetical protein